MSMTFATIYNIPRFFELERIVFTHTNETMVGPTTLRKNSLYVSIYMTWMKLVSHFVLESRKCKLYRICTKKLQDSTLGCLGSRGSPKIFDRASVASGP